MVKLVMEEEPCLLNENDTRLQTPVELSEKLGYQEIASYISNKISEVETFE